MNPIASSKIDGIYNIEDIAGTKFEMQLKILTSTGADLSLNGLKSTNFNPQKEIIYGKEELSWYLFDNNDLENILPLGPDKRLTIESDGPLFTDNIMGITPSKDLPVISFPTLTLIKMA